MYWEKNTCAQHFMYRREKTAADCVFSEGVKDQDSKTRRAKPLDNNLRPGCENGPVLCLDQRAVNILLPVGATISWPSVTVLGIHNHQR